MKMKKYSADTMVDVMKKVRMDFGDDAIILSSTVVKSNGILGFFKKKTVEVVAGFDEPAKVNVAETALPFITSDTEKRVKIINIC